MFAFTRTRRRTAVALGAAAVLVAGLTSLQTPGAQARASGQVDVLPYADPSLSIPQRVDDLLGRMSVAEKIGQMTQAERASVDSDADLPKISGDHLGSVLSGGGSVPTPNTPTAWADMVDRYQAEALTTPLHIPLIYGIDTVHGDGNMDGATVFPHNIGLGATRDPALVRRVEHVAASETRSTGPQWAFAPCLCVARDDRWGRIYESFGESPALVESMETAIAGFQGPPGHLSDNDRVLATAKHFAGDGLTTYGTGSNNQTTGNYPIDQGVDQVDHATFKRLALDEYVPAIQRYHVGAVMPSYSDVDWTEDGLGNPINMHGNADLIQGWLKDQQNFHGIVISDYNGIDHIDPTAGPSSDPAVFRERVAAGVNAGIDMFMQPSNFEDFESTLTGLVEDGTVPMSRIDDAVSRILTVKFELGLFEHPFTDRTHLSEVGDAAHRRVARQAVQESQVLLQNNRRTLPLSRDQHVYVAGSNADNIGNQAGGWTLTWQGGSTNVIPGTTIVQGIRQEAGFQNVTWSEDASDPVGKKDVGVVVVGETPYSEGFGDVFGPQWAFDPGDHNQPRPVKDMQISDSDQQAISTVCSQAKRCVVVIVSGRPLILKQNVLDSADSIVEAWLPGSEGEGVSDTLFGRAPYGGQLPVTWPKTLAQEPINVGDASYHPLYPFGWGLRTR